MASSGKLETGKYYFDGSRYRTGYLTWSQTKDIENNRSKISWKIVGRGSSGGFVYVHRIRISINNNEIFYKSNLDKKCWYDTKLAEGNTYISHNNSGAASLKIDISIGFEYYDQYNKTASKSFTLDTIPRAADISSVKDITLGEACEIKWTPKLSTHHFRIRFASTDADIWKNGTYDTWYGRGSNDKTSFINYKDDFSGSLISPNSTQTQTYRGFILPIEEIAKKWMPNASTRSMRVYLATYDSSGKIVGSPTSKDFKVTVPASVTPTLGDITATVDNSGISDTALKNKIDSLGLCLVGYSKIKLSASATGVYNSTISSYKISGGTYSYTFNGSSLSWSGSTIESFGVKTFSVQAVDSRGRLSTTKSKSITAYNYSAPRINSFTVARDDNNQKKVQVNVQWSYTSLSGNNEAVVKLYYKLKTQKTWAEIGTISGKQLSSANDISTAVGTISPNKEFLDTKQYDFKTTIRDKISSFDSAIESISTRRVLLDFKAGGRGLGVGKICQEDRMEVALPLSIEGGLEPLIINSGDNIYKLNSKEKAGIYVCLSADGISDKDVDGNKVENSPVDIDKNASFLLEVLPLGKQGQILQRATIFTQNDSLKQLMCRYIFGNGQCTKWKSIPIGAYREIRLSLSSDFKLDEDCRYYCTRQGDLVNLYARLRYIGVNKVLAGDRIKVATLRDENNNVPKSSLPKHQVMAMGMMAGYRTCVAWLSKEDVDTATDMDVLFIRPGADLSTNQYIEFNLTWDVDANWALPSST